MERRTYFCLQNFRVQHKDTDVSPDIGTDGDPCAHARGMLALRVRS